MPSSVRSFLSLLTILILNFTLNSQLQAQEAETANCPDPNSVSWDELWEQYVAALNKVEDPTIKGRKAIECVDSLSPHISKENYITLSNALHRTIDADDRAKVTISYLKNRPSLFDEDLSDLAFLMLDLEYRERENGFTGGTVFYQDPKSIKAHYEFQDDYSTIVETIRIGLTKSFEKLKQEYASFDISEANEHRQRLENLGWSLDHHRKEIKQYKSSAPGIYLIESYLLEEFDDSFTLARNQKVEAERLKTEMDKAAEKKIIQLRSLDAVHAVNSIQQKLEQKAKCLEENKK